MKQGHSWRERLELVLVFFFIALVVRTFVMTTYRVSGEMMTPNLYNGDFIFASRLPFGFRLPLTNVKIAGRAPQRGEIVVYSIQGKAREQIKRIIAVPGDRIEIKKGELLINEIPISYKSVRSVENGENLWIENAPEGERMVRSTSAWQNFNFGPEIVPPGNLYLMNDFRGYEGESKPWSAVSIEQIEGKLSFIWFSVETNQQGSPGVRWNRILQSP